MKKREISLRLLSISEDEEERDLSSTIKAMKINTNLKKIKEDKSSSPPSLSPRESSAIEEVLTRGVEKIYPSREALEKILKSGKKLRVYHGIDPTGKLHIGHMVSLRKLRQLQDLGHEIIVLIGDFTAIIGDPTGKKETRKPLTREQVLANAKDYKKQISKILDLQKLNIRFLYNEAWTNKLKPRDMLELASHFTVARLLERDMFQERIKAGREIYVHEFLYPIFQAYDSVTMGVDLEVGGNDQTFNMLAGRALLKKIKNKDKFVLALKLLTDPSGRKMGKTEGNVVNLDEKPEEMFGKIMSWPDGLTGPGFELCTGLSLNEVSKILNKLKMGQINPRDAKARLARDIVATCYDKKTALKAEREFETIFKEKKLPSKLPEVKIKEERINILELLVKTKLVNSKSEAKRLILQKGVRIDGKIEENWQKIIQTKREMVIQIGKRKFVKII